MLLDFIDEIQINRKKKKDLDAVKVISLLVPDSLRHRYKDISCILDVDYSVYGNFDYSIDYNYKINKLYRLFCDTISDKYSDYIRHSDIGKIEIKQALVSKGKNSELLHSSILHCLSVIYKIHNFIYNVRIYDGIDKARGLYSIFNCLFNTTDEKNIIKMSFVKSFKNNGYNFDNSHLYKDISSILSSVLYLIEHDIFNSDRIVDKNFRNISIFDFIHYIISSGDNNSIKDTYISILDDIYNKCVILFSDRPAKHSLYLFFNSFARYLEKFFNTEFLSYVKRNNLLSFVVVYELGNEGTCSSRLSDYLLYINYYGSIKKYFGTSGLFDFNSFRLNRSYFNVYSNESGSFYDNKKIYESNDSLGTIKKTVCFSRNLLKSKGISINFNEALYSYKIIKEDFKKINDLNSSKYLLKIPANLYRTDEKLKKEIIFFCLIKKLTSSDRIKKQDIINNYSSIASKDYIERILNKLEKRGLLSVVDDNKKIYRLSSYYTLYLKYSVGICNKKKLKFDYVNIYGVNKISEIKERWLYALVKKDIYIQNRKILKDANKNILGDLCSIDSKSFKRNINEFTLFFSSVYTNYYMSEKIRKYFLDVIYDISGGDIVSFLRGLDLKSFKFNNSTIYYVCKNIFNDYKSIYKSTYTSLSYLFKHISCHSVSSIWNSLEINLSKTDNLSNDEKKSLWNISLNKYLWKIFLFNFSACIYKSVYFNKKDTDISLNTLINIFNSKIKECSSFISLNTYRLASIFNTSRERIRKLIIKYFNISNVKFFNMIKGYKSLKYYYVRVLFPLFTIDNFFIW